MDGRVWVLVVIYAVGAVAQSSTRNVRFLAFAAVWSGAWLASQWLSLDARTASEIGLLVVGFLALAVPSRLGLASTSIGETRADRAIRELAKADGGATDREPETEIEVLLPLISRDPLRRMAVRLADWSAKRRRSEVLASTTPARYFALAAMHRVHDAEWRRVLGAKPLVSAWDEEMALRCFDEEATHIIPAEALVERPLVPRGDWVAQMETLLDELRRAPFRDPTSADLRRRLVAALESKFDIARGDRSTEVRRRHAEDVAAMNVGWQLVHDRIVELHHSARTHEA